MKFNAKKGKLVTLFAKAYFGFSLTVLGCVLLVFWASDRYYDHMLLTPDMDAAAEDVHMISREYEKVNCFRYFGKNGGFAVFDPEGSLLYRDEKNFPYLLDIDEVLCVPDYDDFSFINSYELDVAQSGGEYLVVKTIYRENQRRNGDKADAAGSGLSRHQRAFAKKQNAIYRTRIQHFNRKLPGGCGSFCGIRCRMVGFSWRRQRNGMPMTIQLFQEEPI